MRDALSQTLYELAKEDNRIVVLVADISPAGAMDRLRTECPEQFINVGVAEQAMVGIAAGLAQRGMRPVCYTIATFALFRPYEFIRNDLAYQNLPVTIVGMGAGLSYSTLGGTHQAVEDVAVALACPNLTVLAPCDPEETRSCIRWCMRRKTGGPVYLRIGKAGEPKIGGFESWQFGAFRRVYNARLPSPSLVVSYGPIADEALKVARALAADMVTTSTLTPASIKDLAEHCALYSRAVVIEEAAGAPLGTCLAAEQVHVRSFALPRGFAHMHGTRTELLAHFGLTAEKIVEQIRST